MWRSLKWLKCGWIGRVRTFQQRAKRCKDNEFFSFEMHAEAIIAQAPQAKPARYPHQPRPSSVFSSGMRFESCVSRNGGGNVIPNPRSWLGGTARSRYYHRSLDSDP